MFNPGINQIPFNYLRDICITIDSFIYFILDFVFKVFFNLASANFLDNEMINAFYSNIQLLLGVYITFKLIFSLLNYLIDPDRIKDNKVGVKNLIMRIVVSLSLLTVLIPMSGIPESNLVTQNSAGEDIYTYNYYLKQKGILFGTLDIIQDRILEQNVIGKIIFGNADQSALNSGYEAQAQVIVSSILKSFITIPVDSNDNPVCTPKNDKDYGVYEDMNDYSTILDLADTSVCSTGKKYAFTYVFLGSWICGILFIVIVAGFCIDVATRLIKLTVLRLIAPIPIISYISPDSSKNGAFSAWTKMLTKTYLDLFVRIAVIYFITYLASSIVTSDMSFVSNSVLVNGVSRVLVILALFIFARQAPKFLMDMLGIKGDGKGFFSGIGAVAGLGAFTGGLVGSAATNWRAASEENAELHKGQTVRNFGRNLLSAGAGVLGGSIAGGGALLGKDPSARAVMEAQRKRNALRASHSTLPGRVASRAYGMVAGRDLSEAENNKLKYNNEAFDKLKAYKSVLEDEALKQKDIYGKDDDGNSYNYQVLSAALERARGAGAATFDYDDGTHVYHNLRTDAFDTNRMNDIKSDQAQNFSYLLTTGQINNGTARNAGLAAERAVINAGIEGFDGTYKSSKSSMGTAKDVATEAETSMETIMRRANDQANKNN